jgi:CelD/BcsL family acetyltransferase involved in cellulose biosynthesis
MLNSAPGISIRPLEGFDDPVLDEATWSRLLRLGQTNTVFLTRWWQKSWWEVFGRGRLLLLGLFRGNEPVGLAPLFADGGMVFFTGSGGSDYLDFVGEVPDDSVLAELLSTVVKMVPDFVGFRFYHVPDRSRTASVLRRAADRLGLTCYDEGQLAAPAIDLRATGEQVTRKKSLMRHQRFFDREGTLVIRHLLSARDILDRLGPFFEQHIARWAVTPYPSLFLDPMQRRFYEVLAESSEECSWLRFTEVSWNEKPIAFHFGFCYGGSYLWYKPSFEIDLAKRSPGEVLLRSLLLAALEEGASVFDLGLGAEPFKERFATQTQTVRTWGLYPRERIAEIGEG